MLCAASVVLLKVNFRVGDKRATSRHHVRGYTLSNSGTRSQMAVLRGINQAPEQKHPWLGLYRMEEDENDHSCLDYNR